MAVKDNKSFAVNIHVVAEKKKPGAWPGFRYGPALKF
jgi:hypothetical protein